MEANESWVSVFRSVVGLVLLSFVTPISGMWIPQWIPNLPWQLPAGTVILSYVSGLVLVCWPFKHYTPVIVSCVAAAVYCFILSLARMLPMYSETPPLLFFVQSGGAFLAVLAIGPMVLLSITVAIRRRYWPDLGPHQCKRCGYDLTGAPGPACPECGISFQPLVIATNATDT